MTRAYKEACERLAVAEAEIKRWQAMIESNGRDNQREGGEDYKSIKAQCEEYEKQIGKLNDTVAELQTKRALEGRGAAMPMGDVKAFREWLQKGVSTSVNNTTIGERGGYLVPEQLHDQILLLAEEDCIIRKLANKITVSGSSIDIPVEEDGDSVKFIGEMQDKPSTGVKFRNVHIPIYDIFRAVPVTTQLLEDTAIPIESYIMQIIARMIAKTEEYSHVLGKNDTNSPIGIAYNPEVEDGVTSEKGKLKYDDLINLMTLNADIAQSSIMKKASFIIHPRNLQVLRKEKTAGSGEYIMQPIAQGMPMTLAGIPVYTSSQLSGVENAGPIVLYGDFAGGYTIADRKDLEMLRNPYITMGQVVFQFTKREGGGVTDKRRIVRLFGVSK